MHSNVNNIKNVTNIENANSVNLNVNKYLYQITLPNNFNNKTKTNQHQKNTIKSLRHISLLSSPRSLVWRCFFLTTTTVVSKTAAKTRIKGVKTKNPDGPAPEPSETHRSLSLLST